eukprot:3500482-Rhodomonas_salina.1
MVLDKEGISCYAVGRYPSRVSSLPMILLGRQLCYYAKKEHYATALVLRRNSYDATRGGQYQVVFSTVLLRACYCQRTRRLRDRPNVV